jgi:hypothetical protein
MKERPIIFSGESVRAILDGRKSMTRRVLKIQPPTQWDEVKPIYGSNGAGIIAWDFYSSLNRYDHGYLKDSFPYGHIGDRFWVRETWKPGAWRNDGRVAIDYQASPELTHTPWVSIGEQAIQFIPKWLDEVAKSGLEPNSDGRYEWESGKSPLKWKSPIFMPRWASRIILEITDIRVEQLQDITEEDARAEGVIDGGCLNCGEHEPCGCGNPMPDARDAYVSIWNTLNAKRGYPWESNPWVWAISFKVVNK